MNVCIYKPVVLSAELVGISWVGISPGRRFLSRPQALSLLTVTASQLSLSPSDHCSGSESADITLVWSLIQSPSSDTLDRPHILLTLCPAHFSLASDMMRSSGLLLATLLAVSVSGHEYFPGQCPNFTPMAGFDWDKFSSGIWFVTRKFSTKSSCLTYEFKTDSDGFKSVEQVRQLPYSERVGLDHEYM